MHTRKMKLLPMLVLTTLLSASCARGNDSQLTALKIELRAERDLLKETRAELQTLITKLMPFLQNAAIESGPQRSDSSALRSPPCDQPISEFADDIHKVNEVESHITRKLADRMMNNAVALLHGARVVPSIKNGKAIGFKLYAIRSSSIYAQLGFNNGDTILRINGMEFNTPDKAVEVYTKLREVSTLVFDISRRGQALQLTIKIVDTL